VIPTLILLGLAVGRWWLVPVAAVGWSVLLLATGIVGFTELPLAVALGAANTAAGIAPRWALRLVRGHPNVHFQSL
jgi:hypothetical protein